MPYKRVTAGSTLGPTRVLIVGPPNVYKTSSLLTWPRPLQYLCFPGEKGHAVITGTDPPPPGVTAHILEVNPVEKASSQAIVSEVMRVSTDILAGKHGACETFAGDGLHRLYAEMLNSVTVGAFFQAEEFDTRLYGRAHELFRYYLDRTLQTSTPYMVFTCWDGRELDNPEVSSKGSSHIYPDLPGKMAKSIMGEFSIVVYAEVRHALVPGGPEEATWQLKPHGKVWGAAVKAPKEVVMHLPLKIPQSFSALNQALQQAAAKCTPTKGEDHARV